MNYKLSALYTGNQWYRPCYVKLDKNGVILSLKDCPEAGVQYQSIEGIALPGLVNAHSHAFQYGMTGLAENHSVSRNKSNFWTWRETMYDFALSLQPGDMEAIATLLYTELLKHGYTRVIEFHYLHHDITGEPYDHVAEMGERLVSAANKAGIKITLLPVFYQMGGFGRKPSDEQRRFISKNLDEYFNLIDITSSFISKYCDADIGYAIHSLRAVDPDVVVDLCNNRGDRLPLHMHISEQTLEVEQSLAFLGARPVEWVFDHIPVDGSYNFVHATHIDDGEIRQLAASEARVVLCPSTEGNLGDGFFPLNSYMQLGGEWCIGTDSHIGLYPMEELRWLDYGQRLSLRKRNIMGGNNGMSAIDRIVAGGDHAAGSNAGIQVGKALDLVVYDQNHPLLASAHPDHWLSVILFGSNPGFIAGTMINGQWKVRHGRHPYERQAREAFVTSMKRSGLR